jgi:hypothetical protein
MWDSSGGVWVGAVDFGPESAGGRTDNREVIVNDRT